MADPINALACQQSLQLMDVRVVVTQFSQVVGQCNDQVTLGTHGDQYNPHTPQNYCHRLRWWAYPRVVAQAQRFLTGHAAVQNLFNLSRYFILAGHYRDLGLVAIAEWTRAVE